MSKINRFSGNFQAFGINAVAGERTVFNDQATESNTLDDNMSSDFLRGLGINAVGTKPIRESINGVLFTLGQSLAYLHQIGIGEYNASQEYYTGSLCNRSGYIFRSESGPNIGNDPLTDATNWTLVSNGENTGRRINLNGSCDTWQIGTSFTPIAHGGMMCDCFFNQNNVTGLVHDAYRSTNIATSTNGYSLITEVTTGATPGASEYSGIVTRVEGRLIRNVKDQSVTLSFLAYATVTGTYSVSISNYSDRVLVSEYTIDASETWERKTVTFTIDSTSGTWDFDNDAGLRIRFMRSCGSSVQTSTLNAWQSGNYWGSTNQVNNDETIGNLFGIDDIQLEAGLVATSYEHRDDSIACQRYIAPIGSKVLCAGTTRNAGTVFEGQFVLNTPLRIDPNSISGSDISNVFLYVGGNSYNITYNSIGYNSGRDISMIFNISGGPASDRTAGTLVSLSTSNIFYLDAKIA